MAHRARIRRSGKQVKKALDDHGLKCPSSHLTGWGIAGFSLLAALGQSKLRLRRSKTSPLHFCGCATVAEVFTLFRCDLEAHTVMLFSFLKRGKDPFADAGEAGPTAVTLKKSA